LHSRRFAVQKVREEKRLLGEAKEQLLACQEAQGLIQHTAQDLQAKAHGQIASVVSRCLEAVFGEDAYEFRITFERKRGKTEARLSFIRNDNELDPKEASGGGAIDVAAFALRLACLLLSRPRQRLLIVVNLEIEQAELSQHERSSIVTSRIVTCHNLRSPRFPFFDQPHT